MDDDALLAVVHAQRQRAAALIDELHAEEARAVGRPVLKIAGTDTDITERIEIHDQSSSLSSATVAANRAAAVSLVNAAPRYANDI